MKDERALVQVFNMEETVDGEWFRFDVRLFWTSEAGVQRRRT
jgi:hypothetical protein